MWRGSILIAFSVCVALFVGCGDDANDSNGTVVRVTTSLGEFDIQLFDEDAPLTVQNFLNYVERGAYDGSMIHRGATDDLFQGGGFRPGPPQSFPDDFPVPIATDPPIPNEFSASNVAYTIAMALGDDPNSATSQWFINVVDNSSRLDPLLFTVFGSVVEGRDAVDAIGQLTSYDLTSYVPAEFADEFEIVPMLEAPEPTLERSQLLIVSLVRVVSRPSDE